MKLAHRLAPSFSSPPHSMRNTLNPDDVIGKAVMETIDPGVRVVDTSHQVTPGTLPLDPR